MARPKKWSPRQLTPAHLIRGAVILGRYGADRRTQEELGRRYDAFCRINSCAGVEALQGLIGQMACDGLGPATIRNYVRTLVEIRAIRGAHSVMDATECYATDRGGRGHAVDLRQEQADEIVKALCKGPAQADLAICTWMVYATGLKPADVARLWIGDVQLTMKKEGRRLVPYLGLRVRFSKSVRHLKHRRELNYPLKGLVEPPKALKQLLSTRAKAKHRLSRATAAQVNQALKALDLPSLRGQRFTSGSFRRLFSHRITQHCRAAGIEKHRFLLHTSSNMDQAHYSFDNRVNPA